MRVKEETVALNHAKAFIDRIGRARVQLGLGREAIDIELKTLEHLSPTPQVDYMEAFLDDIHTGTRNIEEEKK